MGDLPSCVSLTPCKSQQMSSHPACNFSSLAFRYSRAGSTTVHPFTWPLQRGQASSVASHFSTGQLESETKIGLSAVLVDEILLA
ncbi:hypothetical protein OIU79_007777 [Salix purpurea]|uniref:Uncharacterized protein n=1 Tax=Salix purpurea TaxID=77065 RepID=A0A9Q0TGW9_SALPP|nr:hypothetical protein OIU79_007777 [Salix purpurea]